MQSKRKKSGKHSGGLYQGMTLQLAEKVATSG